MASRQTIRNEVAVGVFLIESTGNVKEPLSVKHRRTETRIGERDRREGGYREMKARRGLKSILHQRGGENERTADGEEDETDVRPIGRETGRRGIV